MSLRFLLAVVGLAALSACGGGSTSTTTTTTSSFTVSIIPTNASVEPGNRGVFAIQATVLDANGAIITNPTVTFSSSNTDMLSFANVGLACAGGSTNTVCACPGAWDDVTNPVVCRAGAYGAVTVTATSSGVTSDPVTVYIHQHVDSVQVDTPLPTCVSQGQTRQFTAHAFSGGQDVTAAVGPFSWNTTQTQVATIDANGLATAVTPGQATIFALVGGFSGTSNGPVTSVPVPFITCAVQSITLHLQNATDTSTTLNTGDLQTVVADVLDSRGEQLNTLALTYVGTQPTALTVAGNAALNAALTGVAPGSSTVVAACTPPDCNIGMTAVFSNAFVATVTGTANTTTVFAASTTGTSLVPIDTSTNTAGTALTLPQTPNSLLLTPLGTTAYLGSANGLLSVDTTAATLAATTVSNSIAGKVLAFSPDGVKVLIADTAEVWVLDPGNNSAESFNLGGVTGGAFAVNAYKGFLAARTTLGVYSPGTTFRTLPLTAAANSVAFLPQSMYGYVSGGAPNAVTVRATCDNSLQGTLPSAASPSLIAALPNGTAVLAVDSPALDVISVSITGSGCLPAHSDSLRRVSLGVGSFTPRQLIISPDSQHAFILSDLPRVLVYNVSDGSVGFIPLAGGASPLAGGITLDGTQLWVGGSDNNVHQLDVASLTDIAQVAVPFTPDLVAVRPK